MMRVLASLISNQGQTYLSSIGLLIIFGLLLIAWVALFGVNLNFVSLDLTLVVASACTAVSHFKLLPALFLRQIVDSGVLGFWGFGVLGLGLGLGDRKSTRLNSSHGTTSRIPSSA